MADSNTAKKQFTYARNKPEETVLYQVIQNNWLPFQDQVLRDTGYPLPDFVVKEFDEYLRCGILAYGFLRAQCESCNDEHLVAFSCKRHGFFMSIPVAYYFRMKLSLQFSMANIIGNLMSNAGEEIIYRGILFVGALSLFGKNWVSVALSAGAFGVAHWDLPYMFQAYIVVVGVVLGITYHKTQNLAVPFIAHMIADILLDSFFQ